MSFYTISRFVLCFFIVAAFNALADPLSGIVEVKKQGLTFYNMHLDTEAAPLFEIAAHAGDPEAQYYMGEVERQKNMFMSVAAQRWYEMSAAQGDIYAMLRLIRADNTLCELMENCAPAVKTSREWADVARLLGEERARSGDGEAMFQLYLLTSDLD